MSSQVKATIEFVKSNSIENTREVESVSIVGKSKEALHSQVSSMIDTWVSTIKDDSGAVVFQCYLKNVKYNDINIASKPVLDASVLMTKDEMFDFISNNQVYITPDTRFWVDDEGNDVKITTTIQINNKSYDGMTLEDAILSYINS
ncbi:hypothetical protein pEaSNUABM50_00490 [Erwinia phage pEa_SNUABM_50]|uniref:Uncharacterized protein n=4 Tax=Eneladusvirus BF TaxID=2560751 RepID=A0A7L8ZNT4_9CAUD|nr:hypothetical protein FDH34_gp450 [Serratia phage BF]QOI71476.1 hypothetical protein pEaSNUABM12_00566 [Erwinia phage pEa_SNUABM_12]QOI71947.1 hypothetical protein pEaSNUABM47_00491 [Erwinia phage pEa_SNUABM_47]QOI72487.1 hypothetical protein pEaSNUABM50_00490 [Erwinia phage pEa_SNUABM_50]QXO11615.1 hypothetical protein pEaSNUABM19_00497 [Erwinia phage pEa_SNUABM_19]AQW88995.1 hypothetical protein BF_0470 [Serratia phage BF]